MADQQLALDEDERSIELRSTWDRALALLSSKVNKVTFESYIKPLQPLDISALEASEPGESNDPPSGSHGEQSITLGVASAFAREWLKRYTPLIQVSLEQVLGRPVHLRFTLLTEEEKTRLKSKSGSLFDSASDAPDEAVVTKRPKPNDPTTQRPNIQASSLPLNEHYMFESFVVGKSNRLAQAAAMAVAASPGSLYNPLFIYGGPGLGKTHLLHAIAHAAREHNPAVRVALIDGETFTVQYVTALKERKTEEFRKVFRSVDIWLVDDVQFLASKEQTKEEFFHTFNALYQTGKQIVLTSDRSPKELRAMDERLRSRFACGLIADIQSPELETRMAILERRCEQEGWSSVVATEVLYYVAGSIPSNVRALEGALNRLVAYSSVMSAGITIDLAQSVLGDYLIEKPGFGGVGVRKSISLEEIVCAVSDRLGIGVEAIRSPRREKEVVQARSIAMYLSRELTHSGLAQIGVAIGGREHTTVQRAIQKIEAAMAKDEKFREVVEEIRRSLDR